MYVYLLTIHAVKSFKFYLNIQCQLNQILQKTIMFKVSFGLYFFYIIVNIRAWCICTVDNPAINMLHSGKMTFTHEYARSTR